VATLIVGMTISLDGFVADRSGRVDRLHPDLERLRPVLGWRPNGVVPAPGPLLERG
jgi:hypothetical protein